MMLLGSAMFLALHAQSANADSTVMRSALALPINSSPVFKRDVDGTETRFVDKTVVDLNQKFFGVKKGDVYCYVSKEIPPLVRLRNRFLLAKEVIAKMSGVNDGTSMILLSVASLSPEAQNAIVDLAAEHFWIETSLEQVRTQSYAFTMRGRVTFSSPVGNLKGYFALDQDPERLAGYMKAFKETRSKTGVFTQDPAKNYDRTVFPTSRHQTYRVAIGYYPERVADTTLVGKLSEAVDEVVANQTKLLGLELEKAAAKIFGKDPGYYADIVDKSPLSENEVAKWKRQLKTQLLATGYSDRKADEILASSRPGPRELLIYLDAKTQVSEKVKPDAYPASAFIWP
jgi:hypothetical protein